MGVVETNQWYATLLGWTAADFGGGGIDAALVEQIRLAQARFHVAIDGICGPQTYTQLLRERQATLRAQQVTSREWLADAAAIAVCEAKITWLRDIVDLPAAASPRFELCRKQIDDIIRSADGVDWDWEPPYDDNFEWCGAFVGYAWRAGGMRLDLRKTYFPSNYRLDRYARYDRAFETVPNPRPPQGPYRKLVELDETSGPLDAHFADGDPPRAGDILLVGGKSTAYGKHVTLVERYDSATGVFTTLEGNATGPGPTGGVRHGVIRTHRPVGLPRDAAATTYHARRLIRPSPADLSA